MRLILIELNEINFDAVRCYIDRGESLPGLEEIINQGLITTQSEVEYENLEPWIQWPSVHMGMTYEQHNIFRLGDVVHSKQQQFFEKVEAAGFKVGAISPMNASNKLATPAYFIPDPWTQTKSDDSFVSRSIASAISQAVNDNSQAKLTISSIIKICLSFLILVNPLRFLSLFFYALSAVRKPWRKALFLDMFLYEIHKTLFRRKNTNFSTVFLNAGAHIQHHYFYNSSYAKNPDIHNPSWYIKSEYDPFFEMIKVYDLMVQDLLKSSDSEFIIATGLSQKPYDSLKFYYRFNNHKKFLNDIGVSFKSVVPRMTRDFLVHFESEEEASEAEIIFNSILVDDGIKLFEEVDNRGMEVFVVLTYSHEIFKTTKINIDNTVTTLAKYITFVAIKNGEHQGTGYAFFSKGVSCFAPQEGSHVSKLHYSILNIFGVSR